MDDFVMHMFYNELTYTYFSTNYAFSFENFKVSGGEL